MGLTKEKSLSEGEKLHQTASVLTRIIHFTNVWVQMLFFQLYGIKKTLWFKRQRFITVKLFSFRQNTSLYTCYKAGPNTFNISLLESRNSTIIFQFGLQKKPVEFTRGCVSLCWWVGELHAVFFFTVMRFLMMVAPKAGCQAWALLMQWWIWFLHISTVCSSHLTTYFVQFKTHYIYITSLLLFILQLAQGFFLLIPLSSVWISFQNCSFW